MRAWADYVLRIRKKSNRETSRMGWREGNIRFLENIQRKLPYTLRQVGFSSRLSVLYTLHPFHCFRRKKILLIDSWCSFFISSKMFMCLKRNWRIINGKGVVSILPRNSIEMWYRWIWARGRCVAAAFAANQRRFSLSSISPYVKWLLITLEPSWLQSSIKWMKNNSCVLIYLHTPYLIYFLLGKDHESAKIGNAM